jgi:hypothetical protein
MGKKKKNAALCAAFFFFFPIQSGAIRSLSET